MSHLIGTDENGTWSCETCEPGPCNLLAECHWCRLIPAHRAVIEAARGMAE